MTYCVESITKVGSVGSVYRITASFSIGSGGKQMTGFENDWVVFHVSQLPHFTRWHGKETKGDDTVPLAVGDKLSCNTPPYVKQKGKKRIELTNILTGESFSILDRKMRNPNQDGRFE